jgi:D-sedoheptulose 7-phosphate isomerase
MGEGVNYFHELQKTLSAIDPTPLVDFVRGCEGTLWLAGNGGSASTAQHWACDLSKAAGRRVQALGCNTAVLTAWANDDDYSVALSNELLFVQRPGDRLLCLSCSGTSPNITTLLRQAWLLKLPRAIITGRADVWPTPVDLVVNVPHTDYGILEDSMSAIGHWLTKELSA